ncbi:MAG: M56 family metallopeptidase [Clostridia bacterium]|nr:M56 family metallopeptidase [Clostridia bacterium]
MTALFLRIVNISISASVFTAVILLLRPLLKKAPRWVYVLLWGLVALRLILPFSIESPVSLMPRTDWIIEESIQGQVPSADIEPLPDTPPAAESTESGEQPVVTPAPPVTQPETDREVNIPFVLSCVWMAGVVGMLAYTVISTHRLQKSLGTAIRLRDNIYESTAIDAPFVLGILKPHIYVPRGLDDGALTYVIAHEQSHIRRADHLWKPLGFLLLTVHWFNPVLWYAYILLCGDIELACDARAVKQFGDDERADYSEVLLAYSAKHRHMISACPLAFGEADVTERVQAVLYDKKSAPIRVVCALIAVTAAAVCFLTQPNDDPLISLDGLIAYFNQPKFVDPRSVPGIQIAEELVELDAVLSVEEISMDAKTNMHIYTMYYTSDGLSMRAELYLPEDYAENDYPTLLYAPEAWNQSIWGYCHLFYNCKMNVIVVYNRGDNHSDGLERVGDYVDLEVLLDIC